MGLTSAMYTGLSGMQVNQTRIGTIGNNVSNVNTTAFKGSRTLFQTQFSHLITAGNGPSATSGGVNPTQVGLGAVVGATQQNFAVGSIETTGIPSDLAIDGDGFFIVQKADGTQAYTRDGAFKLDADNRLVTIDGYAVRGFGVDEGFNVQTGVLQDLNVPLNSLTAAVATENVTMDGDLSADGTIATQGSTNLSQALVDGGGAAATAATALTALQSADATGTALFVDGTTITVSGVMMGDRELPSAQFVVGTDGNTLGDLASWLEGVLGIQNIDGVPGDPGVVIENGSLTINSNAGEQNAIEISGNDITTDNAAASVPFTMSESAAADGSGVRTSFTAYDSLGNPVIVHASFALESLTATGPVWRFFLDTPNDDGSIEALGSGTVTFDSEGNYISSTGNTVSVNRASAGANSPLNFALDFSSVHGLSTRTSNVIAAEQDGFPPGTLTAYSVGADGTVNGSFSNGLSRTLGQVAVGRIGNPEGMVAQSNNLYLLGPNSGAVTVTEPGQLGAGAIMGGTLELSNVDLSNEFIGLITSSTGFQAASRVVSTSSDLLDQLLLIVR